MPEEVWIAISDEIAGFCIDQCYDLASARILRQWMSTKPELEMPQLIT